MNESDADPVCDRCGDNCCGCYSEEAEQLDKLQNVLRGAIGGYETQVKRGATLSVSDNFWLVLSKEILEFLEGLES